MGSQQDKQKLLGLLFDAKEAVGEEKATAWDRFYVEVDRVRSGTVYSRCQVKELLYKDGYWEYARRRRLAERTSL